MSEEPSRVVLLFSGGVDSTVSALELIDEGNAVIALSVDYPGRPAKEREAAASLAHQIPFSHIQNVAIDLGRSARKHAAADGALRGWIPYRNLLFWSIGAHVAAMHDATAIAAGHTEEDAISYSDASLAFFSQLEGVLRYDGTPQPTVPRILLPLIDITPGHWEQLAWRHRKLIAETWSCWIDAPTPCRRCYACIERNAQIVTGHA